LALAPIIATQLLGFVTWRWVFALVALPGLILGLIMFYVIREPKVTPKVASEETPASLGHVLKSRNIIAAMGAPCCAMTGVFVLGALLPLYLTGYLLLDTQRMGLVVSAIGVGGFLGQFGLPGLSDVVRRRVASIAGLTRFIYFATTHLLAAVSCACRHWSLAIRFSTALWCLF
jgi:predicted MFS family arabinose efflux permease